MAQSRCDRTNDYFGLFASFLSQLACSEEEHELGDAIAVGLSARDDEDDHRLVEGRV